MSLCLFQYRKHLFVHIDANFSYSDPLLEVGAWSVTSGGMKDGGGLGFEMGKEGGGKGCGWVGGWGVKVGRKVITCTLAGRLDEQSWGVDFYYLGSLE